MTARTPLLLSAIALTACAASGAPRQESVDKELSRYQPYVGAPITEFSTMKGINGWNSAGREHLVVFLGVDEAYLLTVAAPCMNLDFTNHVGFKTRTPSMLTRFDNVEVGDRERCPITEIRPIDYQRMKAELRQKEAK
ncbi:MAG TPA: DUF6491 family protein [Steroidobacteraceae bacterium]|nr:DUF6491 family protein [Steroidobacteraceae bacterium]